MTTLREAAQQALDALNEITGWQSLAPQRVMDEVENAIAALKAALEQPGRHVSYVCPQCYWSLEQPEQCREWKGLSEDEMGHIYVRSATHEEFARAIEAKLKELNA
jgi:transcription initiation factor IIE alpha subunit